LTLGERSAEELASAISRGDLNAVDHIRSMLDSIERKEASVHSYITVARERALKSAERVQERVRRGERVGRLSGLCVAVKDNICMEGLPTTCASKMLEKFVPPYTATVVKRLIAEDAVILGKSNLDEFAMGSSTEFSAFGPTRNPKDTDRVPGGSSGGSAAAIATEEADLALGSDTGGSVRCPASFCGVVGLKPTYGRVSRYGLIAYANSLEQIGPLAANVRDCALLLGVMAGKDVCDETSADYPVQDYAANMGGGIAGVKIGVPKEFFGEGTERDVERDVRRALEEIEALGAHCEETSLESLEYALAAYYIIAMSEASSNLARFDGLRYGLHVEDGRMDWATAFARSRRLGFGPEVRRRIVLGTFVLSAGYYEQYYLKALKVRTLIRRDFDRAFKKYDLLIGPTMPLRAFRLGERIADPLKMYMCDVDTVPANLAGIPALSVPCKTSGLPVGLQLMGPPFSEEMLLRLGYAYEQARDG